MRHKTQKPYIAKLKKKNHCSDKGLTFRIYKNILKWKLKNFKRQITQFLKWTKYLNKHFFKEDIQIPISTRKDFLYH